MSAQTSHGGAGRWERAIVALVVISTMVISTAPVSASTGVPVGGVRIGVGDDARRVVSSHPAGTRFVFESGVHRGVRITPRDGDRFTGESGAVLSGAKVLEGWQTDGSGRWFVGGQTQQGPTSGIYGCGGWQQGQYADCGHEREVFHAEELFVDGQRWRHVNDLAQADRPGRWFFDYQRDRIYLGGDPTGRTVETSVTDHAFVGAGVRDVVVENLEVRHYANRAQIGVIDGRTSVDWTIRHVDVSYNHGPGISVGAGTELSNCRANHNGQLGLHGGRHDDRASRPTRVRSCEVGHNRQLGFDQGWEAGGTKFVKSRNMIFENNWVHNNRQSKGLWFDLDNVDAVIRSNLIEDNGVAGIFYEISFGAKIHGNIVRHNNRDPHIQTLEAGIWVVDSPDVEVTGNLTYGNGKEILGHHQNRRHRTEFGWTSLRGLDVHHNDVRIDPPGPGSEGGEVGVRHSSSMFEDPYQPGFVHFHNNTYRMADPVRDRVFRWTQQWNWYRPAEWQNFGHDTNSRFTDHTHPGTLPPGQTPFRPAVYGPR